MPPKRAAAAGKRGRDPVDPADPADPAVADPVVAAEPKPKRARKAATAPVPPVAPAAADPIAAAEVVAPAAPAAPPTALAPAPAAPAAAPALVGALDLAISFDTTGSMGPCLYQVRKELARLTKELFEDMSAMGVSVRVAVIAQADYDAHPFITKDMPFSDRAVDVATFITGVAASSGGWNEGEAYEQALRLGNELAWRPEATKAFVLIGDDLPHPPDFHGNDMHVDWRQEAAALAAKGVALYSVQCPCLDIPRAKHFYEALAAAHPKGAYVLLTQFNAIIDMLLALVFYARGDAPALEGHERNLIAKGRYNRGIEVAFNGLLQRKDEGRAALVPEPAHDPYAHAGAGAGAGGGGTKRAIQGPRIMDKRVPVPAGRFQRLDVDADTSIREFVTATGAVFEAGRGFYELSKAEDVSDKKEVVLEHVASGEMFSGTDAKELLGLPSVGGGHVTKKSTPAGYRAYIQSTSYTRKLIRNTTFLYEMA